jgi:hypothetical protein
MQLVFIPLSVHEQCCSKMVDNTFLVHSVLKGPVPISKETQWKKMATGYSLVALPVAVSVEAFASWSRGKLLIHTCAARPEVAALHRVKQGFFNVSSRESFRSYKTRIVKSTPAGTLVPRNVYGVARENFIIFIRSFKSLLFQLSYNLSHSRDISL